MTKVFDTFLFVMILCAFFLASCNTPVPGPTPVPTPTPIPTPIPVPNPVPPLDIPKLYRTGFTYKEGQKGLIPRAPFGVAPLTLELPKVFSWSALGLSTPVRNQGNCGSCYCFGSVQMLDNALKIYSGLDVTLSEQQCVAYSGFLGCDGGDFAYDVLKEGLVTDSKCPYRADGRGCPGGKPTSFDAKALDATNIGEGGVPTIPQLKQTILQFGVISCDVAATAAWDNPPMTGVFSGHSNNINHIVAVDGWDDKLSAWHMKNSWGTVWGVQGWEYVSYGSFSLCHDAAFVSYQP